MYRRLAILAPLMVAAATLPVVSLRPAPHARTWVMAARSVSIKAPDDFKLLGVQVPGAAPRAAHVRTSVDGRSWTRWTPLEFETEVGPDLDSHERGAHTSMPVWTGKKRYIEVRGVPDGATVTAIDPGPDPVAPASAAMASPSKPGIITRAGWGADESIRKGNPDIADSLQLGVVHHTATADSYAKSESDDIIRSIYAYHVKSNGWDDIGYNFLVDRYGQVFEGRYGGIDRNVIGAHAQGFNTGSAGIAVIGNFASSKPPEIAMNSLKRILAWRLDQGTVDPSGSTVYVSNGSNKYPEGEKVSLRRVIGHKDVGLTACPGTPLYGALSYLRSAAYKDGLPKLFEAKVSRAAITPNADGVADALKVTGRFSSTMNWKAQVVDASGTVFTTLSGSGSTVSMNWYGKTSSGAVVPHGTYRYLISGSGSQGKLRTYEVPFEVYKWANGTFMYTESNVTFILTGGDLRHPSNWQARNTRYTGSEWVRVPDTIEKYYPKIGWIGFRDGSLVSADGTVYIISGGKKRPTTKSALTAQGFDTDAIIATTTEALSPHPTGTSFTSSSATPEGSALRSSTGVEGWMLGGEARQFLNKKTRVSWQIRDVDFTQPADELLAAGLGSDDVGFRDGTLIQLSGETSLWMISDGKRRPFPSKLVFTRMGFNLDNVKTVTPAEFAFHESGKTL